MKPSKQGLNSLQAAIPDPHVSITLSSLSFVTETYERPVNSYSKLASFEVLTAVLLKIQFEVLDVQKSS